jgi:acetyl esterase/lipase
MMARLLSLLSAMLAAGCSQAMFAAVNAPVALSGVKVIAEQSFGADKTDKLDIYVPEKRDEKAALPVVVFFYGGRWTEGTRAQYKFVGEAFARRGFVTVIPDYRKYPDVKFPAFVEDGAKAVSWTVDHIAEYGGDPRRIYIAGHSSGAHIGALLATDERYLAAHGKSKTMIKAFAGLAGPYAFTPEEEDLKDMFGPPARYKEMQAPTHVTGKEPAMLLLWGEDDNVVGAFNHEELAAKIKDSGGCAVVKTYPGIDHVWILGALSWLGRGKPDIAGNIVEFFKNPVCSS